MPQSINRRNWSGLINTGKAAIIGRLQEAWPGGWGISILNQMGLYHDRTAGCGCGKVKMPAM